MNISIVIRLFFGSSSADGGEGATSELSNLKVLRGVLSNTYKHQR